MNVDQYDIPFYNGIGPVLDEIVPPALQQVIDFINIMVMALMHIEGIVLFLLCNVKGFVPDIIYILFTAHNATSPLSCLDDLHSTIKDIGKIHQNLMNIITIIKSSAENINFLMYTIHVKILFWNYP